jgi:hypothetical protein
MTFQQGNRVLLLSVPFSSTGNESVGIESVGEVHPISHVLNMDGETWYEVAGWFVRTENIQEA